MSFFNIFKAKYPYHEFGKEINQKLVDFPLLINSKAILPPLRNASTVSYIQLFRGFMENFSSEQFDRLEEIIEWNMLQKIKKNWSKYKELGYSMKLIGDPNTIKMCRIYEESTTGSILPQRNCNFSSEHYDIIGKSFSSFSINLVRIKNRDRVGLKFEEFENLNLDKINKEYLQNDYFNQLTRLINLLVTHNVVAKVIDIGIKSNYKIIILDSDGNLVDGSDNNDEEFHTMRLEFISHKSP